MVRGSTPRSGAARQLVVFLHGYGADGNDLIEIGRAWQQYAAARGFRLAACAGAVRPGAGRAAMVCADLPRSGRTLDRRQQGGAGAGAVSRRRAHPPQAAAVGAGAGRFQPGHHDGAACRAAPRGRAGGDRRLFGPSGRAARTATPKPSPPRSSRGRRCCWSTAIATISSRRRLCSRRRKGLPRSGYRSNGISRPESATASTPKGCAMAANSWPGAWPLYRRDLTASLCIQ